MAITSNGEDFNPCDNIIWKTESHASTIFTQTSKEYTSICSILFVKYLLHLYLKSIQWSHIMLFCTCCSQSDIPFSQHNTQQCTARLWFKKALSIFEALNSWKRSCHYPPLFMTRSFLIIYFTWIVVGLLFNPPINRIILNKCLLGSCWVSLVHRQSKELD